MNIESKKLISRVENDHNFFFSSKHIFIQNLFEVKPKNKYK